MGSNRFEGSGCIFGFHLDWVITPYRGFYKSGQKNLNSRTCTINQWYMPDVSKEPIAQNQPAFDEVLGQIRLTRQAVFAQVNTALIDLYWSVGQYISKKVLHRLPAKALSQI